MSRDEQYDRGYDREYERAPQGPSCIWRGLGCLGGLVLFAGAVGASYAAWTYRGPIAEEVSARCPDSLQDFCGEEGLSSESGEVPEPIVSHALFPLPRKVEDLNSPPESVTGVVTFTLRPGSMIWIQQDKSAAVGVDVEIDTDKWLQAEIGELDDEGNPVIVDDETGETREPTMPDLFPSKSDCTSGLMRIVGKAQDSSGYVTEGSVVPAADVASGIDSYEEEANGQYDPDENSDGIELLVYMGSGQKIGVLKSCQD